MWDFVFEKYCKFLSVWLGHFFKQKHVISKEFYTSIEVRNGLQKLKNSA